MIDILLVFDNKDCELGAFFEKCGEQTSNYIPKCNRYNIEILKDNSLNDLSFKLKTKSKNIKIFISYTHGSKNELLANGSIPFLSTSLNINYLQQSVNYCFACYAGEELGKLLVENGSVAFIGYNDKVTVQRFFNAEKYFVECATFGIKSLLNNRSIKETTLDIIQKYNDCIDELYPKDFPTASLLMENRDCLIFHGDGDFKFFNI